MARGRVGLTSEEALRNCLIESGDIINHSSLCCFLKDDSREFWERTFESDCCLGKTS